jgi:hypothetical protein
LYNSAQFGYRMRLSEDSTELPRDRGINDRVVRREDFIALFADFLDSQLYGRSEHSARPGRFGDENPDRFTPLKRAWDVKSLAGKHPTIYNVPAQFCEPSG